MRSTRARAGLALLVPGALVAGGLLATPAVATTTTTRTVCATDCEFTTIGAAVIAATAGDTIEVRGGTYAESVAVDKSVTLRATAGATVLPGPSYNEAGFRLQADDVTIDGFTIGNRSAMSKTVGIDVSNTSGARVVDSILVNNQRGVSLSGGASDVIVSGTRFADNNGSGPDDNAGLWGDGVTGITVKDSTFLGHTNTAINLAGSSDITVTGSRFEDNGNLAVIWGDTNVTIAGNTGTEMRGSAVYLNHSSHVTVSGNDLAARGGTSAVSVNNIDGANAGLSVTGNVLRGFVRGVGIVADGTSDATVVSGNRFLTTTLGVRNQGTASVDARHNWWGAASGPADSLTDASTPVTNSGAGVGVEGVVDYRDWCVTSTCVTSTKPTTPTKPAVRAHTKLTTTVVARRTGVRVLKVKVTAQCIRPGRHGGAPQERQGGGGGEGRPRPGPVRARQAEPALVRLQGRLPGDQDRDPRRAPGRRTGPLTRTTDSDCGPRDAPCIPGASAMEWPSGVDDPLTVGPWERLTPRKTRHWPTPSGPATPSRGSRSSSAG